MIFVLNTVFKILENKNILIKYFWLIEDDSLAIPVTDIVAIERIFSITNMWTKRRMKKQSLFRALTIEAIIILKQYFLCRVNKTKTVKRNLVYKI